MKLYPDFIFLIIEKCSLDTLFKLCQTCKMFNRTTRPYLEKIWTQQSKFPLSINKILSWSGYLKLKETTDKYNQGDKIPRIYMSIKNFVCNESYVKLTKISYTNNSMVEICIYRRDGCKLILFFSGGLFPPNLVIETHSGRIAID